MILNSPKDKEQKTPTKDILSETQAGEYLERQIKYDKDIWIIEIEDPKFRNPFD